MEPPPSFPTAVTHARNAVRQVNDATIRRAIQTHHNLTPEADLSFSTFPPPSEALMNELSGTLLLRQTDPNDSDRLSLVGCLPNMDGKVEWVPTNLDRMIPSIPDDEEQFIRMLMFDVENYIPGMTDKLGTIKCYVIGLAKMRQSGYNFAVGCDQGGLSTYLLSILCSAGHPRFRDHGTVKADRLLVMDHLALKAQYQGVGLELLLTSHLISNPRGTPMDLAVLPHDDRLSRFCARHILALQSDAPIDQDAGTRKYWVRLGFQAWPAVLGYRSRPVWGLVLQDVKPANGVKRHLPHFYGSSPVLDGDRAHCELGLTPSLRRLTLRDDTPPPAYLKHRIRLQIPGGIAQIPGISPAPAYSLPNTILVNRSLTVSAHSTTETSPNPIGQTSDVLLTTPEAIRQAVSALSVPPSLNHVDNPAPRIHLTRYQAEVANTRRLLQRYDITPAINDIARLRISRSALDSPTVRRVGLGGNHAARNTSSLGIPPRTVGTATTQARALGRNNDVRIVMLSNSPSAVGPAGRLTATASANAPSELPVVPATTLTGRTDQLVDTPPVHSGRRVEQQSAPMVPRVVHNSRTPRLAQNGPANRPGRVRSAHTSNENAGSSECVSRIASNQVTQTEHESVSCNTDQITQVRRSERLRSRIPLGPSRLLQSTAASRARSRA